MGTTNSSLADLMLSGDGVTALHDAPPSASPDESVFRPTTNRGNAEAHAPWSAGPIDPSLIRNELLHELFEAQVELRPRHIAIDCAGATLTYADVERQANQLARYLRAGGAGPGTAIAVLLPRSADVYITLLAILKTGAAYVPLDPDYPADRVSFILSDCKIHALVTTAMLAAAHEPGDLSLVLIDVNADEISRHLPTRLTRNDTGASPEDLSYIIYTSGSTGRPKGVQIAHRSACHLVRAEAQIFRVTPDDRVFQGASIAFDASVEEVWLALFSGAAIVVGTAAMVHAGPALSRMLADAKVTVLSCVPTLLSMMSEDVPGIRLLIVGGEACPQDLVRRWCGPGRRMVNTYGPTEATVIATFADLDPRKPVTIGRPIPNYRAYILDEAMRPVPAGQTGELHIGGIGLARGYVGRPDLTLEKFLPDPFSTDPGDLLYKTGDLTAFSPTGEIEFHGRIDTQVKLRGFRIELTEIESALMRCGGVQSAVVTVREDTPGVQVLVGYIVLRPMENVQEAAIKSQLRSFLPGYMIPQIIESLPSLPTLPSGKLDRKSLPAPARRERAVSVSDDPPQNARERKLAAAWEKLFAPATVSRTDDFFLELGGHSLLAALMVSQLRIDPEFRDLSVLDVYNYPTIAALAAEIDQRQKRSDTLPNIAPAPRAVPISQAGYLACVLAQLPCLYVVIGLYAIQWLAPYLTYSWMIDRRHTLLASVLASCGLLLTIFPALLLIGIAAKWLILGRVKPGRYRMWGWYYLRWWLVDRIVSVTPLGFLSGTPLLNIYLRLMGAKIGRNVHLGTETFNSFDTLSIGDDSSIGSEATLLGSIVEDGWLRIGRIDIGKDAYVGVRSVLGVDTLIEDGASLGDLSMLPAGGRIPAGESWVGSPAKPLPRSAKPSRSPGCIVNAPIRYAMLHVLGILILPLAYLLAIFPGMLALTRLDRRFDTYWFLLAAPLVAVSFVLLLCGEIAIVKWLLLGRVKPGKYPVHSGFYLRKWFVDQLMILSLDVMAPLYATLYLAPWYRLLGAKLGRNAEISTACSASPDMLQIGDESFIADYVSLGAARVDRGEITIAMTTIGKRAFIGNGAMIPAGTTIGDNALIGVLTAPPLGAPGAARADTSWLGSPAVFLPQRQITAGFSEEATFSPARKLYIQRYAIEFFRVILPATCFVVLTTLLLSAILHLRKHHSTSTMVLLFPLLYLIAGVGAATIAIAAKWLLMGRYRPTEKPLWSPFVWRTELVTALHENLADSFLIDLFAGTPLACVFFRLLGSKIGSRVFLNSTCLTEYDLITLGDGCAINSAATLQTHLFEDRVMKMSSVTLGADCTIGAASVVLYDTVMEDAATLGDLSLLMKGESLPAATHWEGTPARRRKQ